MPLYRKYCNSSTRPPLAHHMCRCGEQWLHRENFIRMQYLHYIRISCYHYRHRNSIIIIIDSFRQLRNVIWSAVAGALRSYLSSIMQVGASDDFM